MHASQGDGAVYRPRRDPTSARDPHRPATVDDGFAFAHDRSAAGRPASVGARLQRGAHEGSPMRHVGERWSYTQLDGAWHECVDQSWWARTPARIVHGRDVVKAP